MNKHLIIGFSLLLGIWMMIGDVWAAEIRYQPVNPNFGGNPFNAAPLQSNANAQNSFTDPNRTQRARQTFQQRLDSLVLNQIARELLGNITDPATGELIPGTINTGLSTITITDLITSLQVVIVNNETGETTTVLVPN
ncbi:MAG: curli assembly protein CsgF [Nitrospinota bacterium]|nr:curli assembly protein CsgF [Nitrospinota bacterium]